MANSLVFLAKTARPTSTVTWGEINQSILDVPSLIAAVPRLVLGTATLGAAAPHIGFGAETNSVTPSHIVLGLERTIAVTTQIVLPSEEFLGRAPHVVFVTGSIVPGEIENAFWGQSNCFPN